jgi:hypothetical protein
MDRVRKLNISESYTPSSESYSELTVAQLLKNFPTFYGTRSFLSWDESSSHPSFFLLESCKYCPPIYALVFQVVSFAFTFQNFVFLSLLSYALYTHPPSYSLWFNILQFFARSVIYETRCFAVFFNLSLSTPRSVFFP